MKILALLLMVAISLGGCSSTEENANPCLGVTCSEQGICFVKNKKAVCECYLGYAAEGPECVRDEDVDLAEVPEKIIEPEQPEPGDPQPGPEKPAPKKPSTIKDYMRLVSILAELNKLVMNNLSTCKNAKTVLVDFIQSNRIEIRALAGQLPVAMKKATGPEELKQANQLSKLLDETIWETNQLMAKFVPTCSGVSKYIGNTLFGTPICSYSPGDGKALNCLKLKEW
jgi:hypothetical protein